MGDSGVGAAHGQTPGPAPDTGPQAADLTWLFHAFSLSFLQRRPAGRSPRPFCSEVSPGEAALPQTSGGRRLLGAGGHADGSCAHCWFTTAPAGSQSQQRGWEVRGAPWQSTPPFLGWGPLSRKSSCRVWSKETDVDVCAWVSGCVHVCMSPCMGVCLFVDVGVCTRVEGRVCVSCLQTLPVQHSLSLPSCLPFERGFLRPGCHAPQPPTLGVGRPCIVTACAKYGHLLHQNPEPAGAPRELGPGRAPVHYGRCPRGRGP